MSRTNLHNPTAVQIALDEFVAHYEKSADWLYTDYHAEWSSPCELGNPFKLDDSEVIRWRPVRRTAGDDFAGLESALELTIHPDIKSYYATYWGAGLAAVAPDGPVNLIQLWNDDDVARLTENLIGHALAQQQSKSPFSVFFATTSPDSELFLSVNNETGAVQLEEPGRKPLRTVNDSLVAFIEELVPDPPQPKI